MGQCKRRFVFAMAVDLDLAIPKTCISDRRYVCFALWVQIFGDWPDWVSSLSCDCTQFSVVDMKAQ